MTKVITCLEPLRNIYISRNGYVRVCCHNHHFKIGHLKNGSLLDIWRSQRRKEFAKRLYYGSTELSCSNCYQITNSHHIVPFSVKYRANHQFPGSIDFELSNICNLACSMCTPLYSSQLAKNFDNPDDITFDFHDLPQQLLPFIPHLKKVSFYGGEPFLVEIYYKICDLIIEKNPDCAIYLQTNGTIFNERIEKLLQKGSFNIGLSIESVRKETYETIRKNADFEKVIKNMNRFQQYSKERNTFFGVSICPIRSNWKELPEMITYFSERQIPVHFHLVSLPFNLSLWNLPKTELLEIHDYLVQYKFNKTGGIYNTNIHKLKQLSNQIYKWINEAAEREAILLMQKPKHTEELISELISSASNFLDSLKWMDALEKNAKIRSFSRKLNEVALLIDEDFLKKQLEKLLLTPVYILLSEIEITSTKELKENILYL